MTRKTPTVEQIKRSAGDVIYEWAHFNFCVKQLRTRLYAPEQYRGKDDEDWPIDYQRMRNVLITALAVHARNLHDFFFLEGRKDDIIADDYCPDWSAVRRSLMTPSIAEIPERANKYAAHITQSRSDGSVDGCWCWKDMQAAMKTVWDVFEREADKSLLYPPEANNP
jgi:hypothetical protein